MTILCLSREIIELSLNFSKDKMIQSKFQYTLKLKSVPVLRDGTLD